MTMKNQFELVTASFNEKEKPVSVSYSQFQQAVTTRKNQFELVTDSFNEKDKRVLACFLNFFVSCTTASFNNQEEPV